MQPPKRIVRNKLLTKKEAAKYQLVRKQIAKELPQLISKHHKRMNKPQ